MTTNSGSEPSMDRPGNNIAAWTASVLLAVIFVTLQIRHSMATGALALPPTYDDIGYFIDAADRLYTLEQKGLLGFLRELMTHPVYGPASTALAMLGFVFFGVTPWAAVAANAVPLTLALRAFFWVARNLPFPIACIVAVALVGFPLFGALVLDCRPDMICALLTACGTMFIILRPWADGELRNPLIAGAMFGLSLVAKLTMFHVTMVLYVFAMAIAAIPDFLDRKRRPMALRAGAITWIVAALISIPAYAFSYPIVIDHIRDSVFGPNNHIFSLKISLIDHALFYLTGPGGRFGMGTWFWLAIVAGIAYLFYAVRKGQARYAISTVAMVVIAWLVVSVPGMKTEFIGIVVPAYVLVTFSLMLVQFLSASVRSENRRTAAICTLLCLFSIAAYQSPWWGRGRGPVSTEYARAKQAMLNETLQELISSPIGDVTILQAALPDCVGLVNIEFALARMNLPRPKRIELMFDVSDAAIQSGLDHAQIVIAADPRAQVTTWLPSAATRDKFLEQIRARKDFHLVRTVADPQPNVGPLYIFRRVDVQVKSN